MTTRLSAAAIAALLATSSAAFAADTVAGPAHARAQAPKDIAPSTDEEPGPYAKYLIHLGHSRADALRQAASIDKAQAQAAALFEERRAQGAVSDRARSH